MSKRLFDVVISALGLVALAPLFALLALAIKATSRGPVFFRQERVGRDFRPFRIYKFRTMVVDAPQLGRQITAGRDPRITSIGHVLRKTKLDELPQLINVLTGDMSLVGPRPEVPKYVEMFRPQFAEVLRVRPGITDLASVKYRDESEILGAASDPEAVYVERVLPDKLALASQYVREASFWFDVRLLFATLWKIVR
ncbi:MAG: sugar transferase [Pirellulales bacterium]|nr:sugar transferase [Pirellulales bacterium]